jgi:hypothetical protein
MTKPIQLHVGYVGITREGKRVEITGETSMPDYPFESSEYNSYCIGGNYWRDEAASSQDIVGPWVETPVEPLVDYNDGKWHRWAGGECPVHPDTLVYATFIEEDQGPHTDSRYARNYHWDSGYGPIVAFLVTKEYVEPPKEPREFWVLAGSCFNSDPCVSDAIHVREVMTDD